MTYIRSTVMNNGDVHEMRTNPGCAPILYINGVRQPPEMIAELKWSKWFAWYPVRINGRYVIFKWIYRAWDCRLIHPGFGGRNGSYQYGTIFDVIK